MDDDLRESVEEWAELLGPGFVASLPSYAEVKAALRAGEWARADDAIVGTPFADSADGLSLRGLIAHTRGDRATLGDVARRLEFRERPRAKLWALRETGRTQEAAALLRGSWGEFRRDASVLREGLASAWTESDWTLFISLSEALEVLTALRADQWTGRGWALEKRRRLPDAIDAYIRAYRLTPSPWITKRLVTITMDRDHSDLEERIYAFAAEENAEASADPWMKTLAVGEHFHRRRPLRAVRLVLRMIWWMAEEAVRRGFARATARLGSRARTPRPGQD